MTAADYNGNKQKFLEEARVLAQFHHSGIVQVYSVFEENSTAYMVMEFVKGRTLQKLVDTRGPLPEKEVVGYITQAAEALTAVHEAKLLHRDIKPENLMVTDDGRVVLVDFGTARAFAAGKAKHMTAMLTPGYAPLEQYGQEARFGPYTDLYALGGTCYHLLTGQPPVQATDRAAGVELQPPRKLNRQISQAVSDAVMWALEMKADKRPQSAKEFIKALTGQVTQPGGVDDDTPDDDTPATGDGDQNPYLPRIRQLINERNNSPAPPPSPHDARIAEISRTIELCRACHVQQPNHCPGCGNASLEEITGHFTSECPLCRAGTLMVRKIDPDKCPMCRTGQLDKQGLARPLVFCPICQAMPLKEESRKRLVILTETWWVCGHCKAEFDLGVLKQDAKLVRYEQDPSGLAAKYVGRSVPVSFWLSHSPQCNVVRKCSTCATAFYEFPDASMMLAQCSKDPHGIAAKTLGKRLPRPTWTRLAYNFPPNVGNACCPQCHAEFDFDQHGRTLHLLSCNAGQFAWADKLKGQSLPVSAWSVLSQGKPSSRPGWFCKRCSTEFDSEENGLRLVQSTAGSLSKNTGNVMALSDWQRLGAGVPTTTEEREMQQESAALQAMKDQEEAGFHEREERRRAGLDGQISELVKQALLAGFMGKETCSEHIPLGKSESLCWDARAARLKQRSQQGQSYWDVGDEGKLLVTTDRVIFAAPDGQRWQRPRSKMHTVRVEHLALDPTMPALVMGFDDLQKPVAFWIEKLAADAKIDDYECHVEFTVTDFANSLQSQFSTS
jgi:hypothetical protein